ncbi:MAG: hypothetical protein DDT32_01755 [Syntrophomonadaceae bacterium]|nr:hypothetical protein [Bacillota bacterium]MBT9147986.1 hypothetical protein [Bacillota bacterium]
MSKIIEGIFISDTRQKVLSFFCRNPSISIHDSEVSRRIKDISLASVNNALRKLSEAGLIERKQEGQQMYNKLNFSHPLVKHYRKFLNTLNLYPALEEFKKEVNKIILFGSYFEGTNTEDSDIDLFLVTDSPASKIQRIVNKFNLNDKLKPVIRTSVQYLKLKKEEPVFFEEINRGVIYYER